MAVITKDDMVVTAVVADLSMQSQVHLKVVEIKEFELRHALDFVVVIAATPKNIAAVTEVTVITVIILQDSNSLTFHPFGS